MINQGKQDTSKDNQFEIILSKDELVQIVKLEMDPDWENTIKVTLKVIGENSKYKNRLLWDRVSFSGEFSWKYRNLRKAAGVPYTETEAPNVDIEALLLNKAVHVELTARKGNDGNDYQSIKYKTSNESAPKKEDVIAAVEVEEDNPFTQDTEDEIGW
jgi:hypothetical protein